MADNDLAFGQIVEALSHSPFWPETCIFAIEDDPQAGWDHVSGYRTTAYVASPYTRRGAVVGTQYNQTSLLRTMELMLGLPPMNQMDATATPMTACFTDHAGPHRLHGPDQQHPPGPDEPVPEAGSPIRSCASTLTLPRACRSKKRINAPKIRSTASSGTRSRASQTPYPAWAVSAVRDND